MKCDTCGTETGLHNQPGCDAHDMCERCGKYMSVDIWNVSAEYPKCYCKPKSKQGAFMRASGIIPWKEGDELPEDTIRRLRGHKPEGERNSGDY